MTTAFPLTDPNAAAYNIPAGAGLHSWYCPAISAYCSPGETLTECWQHLQTRFPWVPLYVAEQSALPEGWVLRSYYCEPEKSFYASHRTMSEKTLVKSPLLELYAPPGSYGNDNAGYVPPKLKHRTS